MVGSCTGHALMASMWLLHPCGPLLPDFHWVRFPIRWKQSAPCCCWQERRRTHAAATAGAEESAVLAARAVAHAEALRQAAREEKLAKAQEKRLSFNQKVRGCQQSQCLCSVVHQQARVTCISSPVTMGGPS